MWQQKEDEASFVIGKTTLDMVLKVMHLVRKLDKMSHLIFAHLKMTKIPSGLKILSRFTLRLFGDFQTL